MTRLKGKPPLPLGYECGGPWRHSARRWAVILCGIVAGWMMISGAAELVRRGREREYQRRDLEIFKARHTSAATRPVTQPTTTPTTQPHVPVVYARPKDNKPLTEAQVQEALRVAGELRPRRDGRDIWFIAVIRNRFANLRVVVYYAPDESSPRLRRGRCAVFWTYTGADPLIQPYLLVSRPDKPFGDRLEIPAVPDLPFKPPEDFRFRPVWVGDDELVRVVDVGRAAFDEFYLGSKLEPEPPYKIQVDGDNFYVVNGEPDAGGNYVVVRRRDGRFEATWEGIRLWYDEGNF